MLLEQLLELRKRVKFENLKKGQYVSCNRTYNYKVSKDTIVSLCFEATSNDGINFSEEEFVDFRLDVDEKKEGAYQGDVFINDEGETCRINTLYDNEGRLILEVLTVKTQIDWFENKSSKRWLYDDETGNLLSYDEYDYIPTNTLDQMFICRHRDSFRYNENDQLETQYTFKYDKNEKLLGYNKYEYEYNGNIRTCKEYEQNLNENDQLEVKLINEGIFDEFYDNEQSIFSFNGKDGYQIQAKINDSLTISEDYCIIDDVIVMKKITNSLKELAKDKEINYLL